MEWKDIDGDDCRFYQFMKWCTPNGKYGSGWGDDQTDTFAKFANNGYAADAACCACGGGHYPAVTTETVTTTSATTATTVTRTTPPPSLYFYCDPNDANKSSFPGCSCPKYCRGEACQKETADVDDRISCVACPADKYINVNGVCVERIACTSSDILLFVYPFFFPSSFFPLQTPRPRGEAHTLMLAPNATVVGSYVHWSSIMLAIPAFVDDARVM